jgi:hypothetical protein
MKTIRIIRLTVVLTLAAMIIWGCSSQKKEQSKSGNKEASQSTAVSGQTDNVGGVRWNIPSGWTVGPERQMRHRTYIIKASTGDSEDAECAVFYFTGAGGGKMDNLNRWIGQFEQPDGRKSADVAKMSELMVNNLATTTVDVDGIYRMSAGPMMEVKEKKTNYRMLASIIEGPQGLVFFKMVGPANTIAASEQVYMAMLGSVKGE